MWLSGSHTNRSKGGRAWRWLKTENLQVRTVQRSWVLKVCSVQEQENTFEAGWLSGIFDGEGSIVIGPGIKSTVSQNPGEVLNRILNSLHKNSYNKQCLRIDHETVQDKPKQRKPVVKEKPIEVEFDYE